MWNEINQIETICAFPRRRVIIDSSIMNGRGNQLGKFPAPKKKNNIFIYFTLTEGHRTATFFSAAPPVPALSKDAVMQAARGSSARSGPPQPPPDSAAAPVRGMAAATAPDNSHPRETVLGNCAVCGSSERLKFCSRCNAVRYCGPACQKDDVSIP